MVFFLYSFIKSYYYNHFLQTSMLKSDIMDKLSQNKHEDEDDLNQLIDKETKESSKYDSLDSKELDKSEEIEVDAHYKQAAISHSVGLFWCVMQGLTRGAMYSGQTVAQEETKVKLEHILTIRSAFIILGAYVYGKKDGINFTPQMFFSFDKEIQASLFWRSFWGYGSIVSAMAALCYCP